MQHFGKQKLQDISSNKTRTQFVPTAAVSDGLLCVTHASALLRKEALWLLDAHLLPKCLLKSLSQVQFPLRKGFPFW